MVQYGFKSSVVIAIVSCHNYIDSFNHGQLIIAIVSCCNYIDCFNHGQLRNLMCGHRLVAIFALVSVINKHWFCFLIITILIVIYDAFSALTLLVGRQEEHLACKN